MRRTRTALLLAASLVATLPPLFSIAAEAPPPRKIVRVLFVGNSYTYFNELPQLFADFAEASHPGLDVVAESVTAPGESLRGHWGTGTALKRIQGERWDYVVLQEHVSKCLGSYLVDGEVRYSGPEELFTYGERFATAAVAAGARPVFYPPYERKDPSDDLRHLEYAFSALGKKTGALVAPVARTWHRVREARHLELYHADGAHPSPHGSYLVAGALAATLWGEPAAAETPWHPTSVPESDARELLAAVHAVRQELAASGAAEVPAPAFTARPRLDSSTPIGADTLGGTWSARRNAFDLSLGSRLRVTFDAAAPQVELVDFTLNGAFPLPIENLGVNGNVLRFTTRSQNRTYHLQVARRGEGLEVLVEQPRAASVRYSHVDYLRDAEAEHFEFLTRQLEKLAGQETQEGFETALKSYYEALAGRLGAEPLSRILNGESPLSHEWWAILAGEELCRQHRFDEAIRFYTFATHQFPKSAAAFQNLSEGLEKGGRFEEAYGAIVQAEALLGPEEPPQRIAIIQKTKARLEKLRPTAR